MKDLIKEIALNRSVEALYTGGIVEWSPNGSKLFSTCSNVVKVIDLTGVLTWYTIGDPEEELRITCICIDKNRNRLLVAYNNQVIKEYTIPLVEGEKPEVAKTWKTMHSAPVLIMKFDESGDLLATGSADHAVKVWNLKDQQCTHTLKGPAVVSAITFAKYDRIVVGYIEGQLNLYDLSRGAPKKLLHEWKNHTSQITCLLQVPNTKKVVVLSRDQTASIHDSDSLKTIKVLPLFESVESGAIAHNGNLLTVGEEGVVKEWIVESAKLVRKQRITGTGLDFLAYNEVENRFLTISAEENLFIVDFEGFNISRQIVGFHDEIYSCCLLGKDESFLAAASNTSEIRLYNIETLDCQLVRGHSASVLAVVSPAWNQHLLISCSKDNSIIFWKLTELGTKWQLMPLAAATGHANSVTSICPSNPGKSHFLVSVSSDCTIKMWPIDELPKSAVKLEAETMEGSLVDHLPKLACSSTLVAHGKEVNCVDVAESNNVIATGGMDKLVKLWQVDLGRKVLGIGGTLTGHKRGVGDKVASCSGDMTIKLWSVTEKTCLQTLAGHSCAVFRILFVNDDKQMISADSAGIVKIWTLKNGECESSVEAHSEKIWSLTSNAEETQFVTAGSDGRIAFWKDVTEEKQMLEDEKRREKLEQEQTLTNLLDQNRHQEALEFALNLARPYCALKVINALMDEEGDALGQAIAKLDDRKIQILLDFTTQWNTNSRTAQAAQQVFFNIVSFVPPEELLKIPNARGIVEALIPYTKRHFDRLNRARQDSAMLEFIWKQMRI